MLKIWAVGDRGSHLREDRLRLGEAWAERAEEGQRRGMRISGNMVLSMSIALLLADLSLRDQLRTPSTAIPNLKPNCKRRVLKMSLWSEGSGVAPLLDAKKCNRDQADLPKDVVEPLKALKKT